MLKYLKYIYIASITGLLLAAAACSSGENSATSKNVDVSGAFLYLTRDGKELRQLYLPSGHERVRLTFPVSGAEPGVGGDGGLAICNGQILTTLIGPDGTRALFKIDLIEGAAKFYRRGLWPFCGPGESVFYFASEPGSSSIGLYASLRKDLSRSTLLLDGKFAGIQPIVFIEGRYMATFDPSRNIQVVFELSESRIERVWSGDNCRPLFWRARTREIVCEDSAGAFRSQRLMQLPGKLLLDAKSKDIRGVLHYWPEQDAILSTTIRGGWAAREYQDLIVVDLNTSKITTVLRGANIDATRFAYSGQN